MASGHDKLLAFRCKRRGFRRRAAPVGCRIGALPDGTEWMALMRQAERLAIAWMPYKFRQFRLETHLTQARLVGYRRLLFRRDWFHLVELV